MLAGLRKIKFPHLSRTAESPWPTQVLVAIALLALVGLARLLVDGVAPGVARFSLLLPGALAATLLAGWLSGAIVAGLGSLTVWTFYMGHRIFRPGIPASSAEVADLLIFLGSAIAIIALAQAQRTGSRRLGDEQAQRLHAQGQSLADLRQLFENAPGFMAVVRGEVHVVEFSNRAFRRLVRRRSLANAPLLEAIPQFPTAVIEMLDKVRATGQPLTGKGVPVTLRRRSRGPEEVRHLDFVLQPLMGATGEVERIYMEGFDVTEAIRSQAALVESEERLRVAGEAARMAIWRSHPTEGFSHTPELNVILGLPKNVKLTADQMRSFYLPGELERVRAYTTEAFARGERNVETEIQFRRADGAVRWVLMRGEMRADENGEPRGAYGVTLDITDRKMSEERMTLLAREVDHRANNLLTVMLGTVQLSKARTVEALRAVLLGRISALGRAHQLLSDARWQGADLRRLVEEELLAFSLGEAARVTIEGPDTALTPPAAQGLAMALHELATNAAKYGALSVPSGRVEVRWSRNDCEALVVSWTESGGPPVTRPTRHGLGTTILSRALSGPTNGVTRVDWRAEGVVCVLELPAPALRADVAPGSVSPPASPRPAEPEPRP